MALHSFITNNINAGSNYIKIVLQSHKNVKDDESSNQCIQKNTSLSRDEFYDYLRKIMQMSYKYSQKQFKELVIGNTHYYNFNNQEVQVYSETTNNVAEISNTNTYIAVAQNRSKLSILGFPSTRNIYVENVKRRLTFRITNRIFVNFEHGEEDGTIFYNIYLNFNHDKDVDVENAIGTIEKVLQNIA